MPNNSEQPVSSWAEFAQQAPALAEFGAARFKSQVAYLGTLSADGSPRVHPVTPIVGEQLYLFMEPTSPKGRDLERDPRFALHCSVEDLNGGGGEFYVRGRAWRATDALSRELAVKASSYAPAERYILFRLELERAFMNRYIDGQSNVARWQAGA